MTIATTAILNGRENWPYPALVPFSLKAYPIVQIAKSLSPQKIFHWPPPINEKVAEWAAATSRPPASYNQIYLHIPFCPFLCHFCPLFKVKRTSERTSESKARFVEWLIKEIQLYGRSNAATQPEYGAIYFGGGTPTELTASQLKRILKVLRDNFRIAPDAEITLEGVASQLLHPGYLEDCMSSGVNRLSWGVQSLDAAVRRAIGRGDSMDDYAEVANNARKINPHCALNIDLMVGLPFQTLDSLANDIDTTLKWGLSSLDIYYYVMMPGTRLNRNVRVGNRPSPTSYGENLHQARSFLMNRFSSLGFERITSEVFVRNERDLAARTAFGGGGNGMNTVLALGPSAFGHLNGTVYHNVCDLSKYGQLVESDHVSAAHATHMNLAEARRRAVILSLIRQRIPNDVLSGFERYSENWIRKGLAKCLHNSLELTDLGAVWFNHMQMEVLPFSEMLQASKMFGSLDEQLSAWDSRVEDLNAHDSEFRRLVVAKGWEGNIRNRMFKYYLRMRHRMGFDKRAMGFTGPIELEK